MFGHTRQQIRRRVAGLAVIVLFLAISEHIPARAAPADIGVGITAEPITLGHSVAVGGSYAMGPVTVVNTGTEAGTIALRLAERPDGHDLPVPKAWITFDRDEIRLDAGDREAVAITLAVPDDAPAGEYRSLLFASLTKQGAAGANGIGAEAATEIAFTVGDQEPMSRTSTTRFALAALVAAGGVLLTRRIIATRRYRPRHLSPSNSDRSTTWRIHAYCPPRSCAAH